MVEKFYVLWGEEGRAYKMTDQLLSFIIERLGMKDTTEKWDGYFSQDILPENVELASILGNCISREHISFNAGDRFYHSVGKGGEDFAFILDEKKIRIVDAVVSPNEDELRCFIAMINANIGIIPYGGGTTVTGGISPGNDKRYYVSVDMKNINFLKIDKDNMMVTAGAGLKGPELEEKLNKEGLTLGHFPESFLHSTVGGWVATNAAGQESNRYGKIRDMVVGIEMVSPSGILSDRIVPNQSSYFRPLDIAVGSEGTLGIITKVSLRIRKMPKKLYYQSFIFPDFMSGVDALREAFTNEKIPLVARLSDEVETELSFMGMEETWKKNIFENYLKLRGVSERGSLLMVINEYGKIKGIRGGVTVGSAPSRIWIEGRYDRPYLYNSLLKRKIIADTIETSVIWSGIRVVYNSVKESFYKEIERIGIKGIIMCHLSHEYTTGSALYFTYLFYSEKNKTEILKQLRETIVRTIIGNGGAISHHHGIGRSFRPFLKDYEGINYELIKSIKKTLDPEDIMNPGLIE